MSRASKNSLITFVPVTRGTHLSILAPITKLISAKIVADGGPSTNLAFSADEVNKLVRR